MYLNGIDWFRLETDRYYFVEIDTDIFKKSLPIFSQLPIFVKIIRKRWKLLAKVLPRHEKFCWTNFKEIRKFLLQEKKFGTKCAVYKHTKISVKICMQFEYSVWSLSRKCKTVRSPHSRKVTITRDNKI